MAVVLGISVNCSGVFYAPVAQTLGVGRGDVAMYITIMNLVTGFLSPFSARLVKRYPLRPWLMIGGVLTAASLALWSQVRALWQLYVLAVTHGIGNVMLGTVILNMIIGAWFTRRTGLVMGIMFSFSGIAGALLSPLFQRIMDHTGWQTAHDVAAILAAALIIPGVFLLRMDPSEKGLAPYGGDRPAAAKEAAPPRSGKPLADTAVLVVLLAGFVTAFLSGLGQHIAGFATSVGLSAARGALLVTAVMIGNMASKLLFGVMSDRAGAKPTFILFLLITMAGVAGLLILKSYTLLMITAFLLGFTYSLAGVGLSQLTRGAFDTARADHAYALSQTSANIGSSIASAAIGYVYDLSGSYRPAFLFCIVLAGGVLIAVTLGIKGSSRLEA